MAKLTHDEIIQISSARYAECEKIIGTVAQAIKKKDPEFKPETAMACFDIILQSCLFNAAVADGKLEEDEINFIMCLTRYVDLMSILNKKLKEEDAQWPDVKWDDIATLKAEAQEALAIISAAAVAEYANAFVNIFATVDKILTEVDLLKALNEKVIAIFVALAGADGDDLENPVVKEEATRAAIIYNTLVVDRWKEITGE